MSDNTDATDDMTHEQKLRDQFLRAEHSTEADAAPRIEVSEHDGNTRIDIADTAAVRPGPGPGVEGAEEPESGR
ncbi:multidrug transporter [Microbacterium sp. NPDC089321]|uniref:multidrug transporter n=1 Tax=Microbacterium sp. NPDC089321 TaxID=3155183 RepID=UPI003444FD1F